MQAGTKTATTPRSANPEAVLAELISTNFAVIDDFVSLECGTAIRQAIEHEFRSGNMHRGGVAPDQHQLESVRVQLKPLVRGDMIGWYDGSENGQFEALAAYIGRLEVYVRRIADLDAAAGRFGQIRRQQRAMCAVYPGEGARYTVHTDNDCHNGDGEGCNGRRLTTILYLNPAWSDCHGGQLRIYTDETRENSVDIAPVMGRVVLFWSDSRVPHEVQPCFDERYSVTMWFEDEFELHRAEHALLKSIAHVHAIIPGIEIDSE